MNKNPDFLVITGSRSEWFILEPVVKRLKDFFFVKVVATGSHLARDINTIEYIEKSIESRYIIKLHTYVSSDELCGRAKTMAIEVMGFVDMFYYEKPRGVIVLGDREETIAAGVAANYLNIPLIHLGGGDKVVGNVDDTIRHAVTKLAHLHFPFTEMAYKRIMQMGEEEWRVTLSGSPSLDEIRLIPFQPKKKVLEKLSIPYFEKYAVVLYHPISSEHSKASKDFESLMNILEEEGRLFYVIIQPNMDPGSAEITRIAKKYSGNYPGRFAFFNTLPRDIFINLLRNAEFLIGNSSLGIHEAPFLKLPVINILPRQKGRDHSDNVVFVDLDRESIINIIKRIIDDDDYRDRLKAAKSIYGDGNAVERIINKLREFNWENNRDILKLLNKRFIDR